MVENSLFNFLYRILISKFLLTTLNANAEIASIKNNPNYNDNIKDNIYDNIKKKTNS